MTSNISSNPNFTSLKVFNTLGNYFNIDSQCAVQTSSANILLNSVDEINLNSKNNSSFNAQNGNLTLKTGTGNLVLSSMNQSKITLTNNDIFLNTKTNLNLVSDNINFTCKNINIDLVQEDGTGSIINRSQSYTVTSNDIYLMAADDIVISAGLSNGLPISDNEVNSLHTIQIGLDNGLHITNDNVILGNDSVLDYTKKFQLSLNENISSDILNLVEGETDKYYNGVYVLSNLYNNKWIQPELGLQRIIPNSITYDLYDSISMGMGDTNYINLIGKNNLDLNINKRRALSITNNGDLVVGKNTTYGCLNINKDNCEVYTHHKNIISDEKISFDYVNLEGNNFLSIWVTREVISLKLHFDTEQSANFV